MSNKVAIHQPNYLPWMGYFYKMSLSDHFIFLDTVQYSKGSYQNRVKIKTPQGSKWLTQPVSISGSSLPLTKDVKFADPDWPQKHLAMLHSNYSRSGFWKQYRDELQALLDNHNGKLSEINIRLVKWLAGLLEIEVEFYVASDLDIQEDDPSLRLIKLVKKACGDTYLHGVGALNYQENELFFQHGIEIKSTNFQNPHYRQLWGEPFESGLSVVDLLFNEGLEAKRFFKQS